MTVDTLAADAPSTEVGDAPSTEVADAPPTDIADAKPARRKAAGKKARTVELTLTVIGTADGEWRAELKQGTSYLVRDLTVAAAAVSRAARELHEDLAAPLDTVIEEARSQQLARVAALEAELDAARAALAGLE